MAMKPFLLGRLKKKKRLIRLTKGSGCAFPGNWQKQNYVLLCSVGSFLVSVLCQSTKSPHPERQQQRTLWAEDSQPQASSEI